MFASASLGVLRRGAMPLRSLATSQAGLRSGNVLMTASRQASGWSTPALVRGGVTRGALSAAAGGRSGVSLLARSGAAMRLGAGSPAWARAVRCDAAQCVGCTAAAVECCGGGIDACASRGRCWVMAEALQHVWMLVCRTVVAPGLGTVCRSHRAAAHAWARPRGSRNAQWRQVSLCHTHGDLALLPDPPLHTLLAACTDFAGLPVAVRMCVCAGVCPLAVPPSAPRKWKRRSCRSWTS